MGEFKQYKMSLISQPSITFHNEEIHSYDQYMKGNEIRFASVSTLLAKTMFTWFGNSLSITPVSIDELAKEFQVTTNNEQLFNALLRVLQKGGYLYEEAGRVWKSNFDTEKLDRQAEALQKIGLTTYGEGQWLHDAVGPSFDLAEACIPKLPDLLRGDITSVQLLFSAENYERSTAIYGAHLQQVYYGLIAEQIIKKCHQIWAREPERQIRILEIGAGSGKGTVRMLEGLRAYGDKIHFCFTDIGNSFLRRAKRTFKSFDCELDYRLLDISDDPVPQGFEENSFDIAFATNVLHATPDLRVTLKNVYKLLAPEGNVYINEITTDMAVNTVSYGTTPGWWLPDDGLRLPYSPVVTTDGFKSLLTELGFNKVRVIGYPGVPESDLVQAIIQGNKNSNNHE